MSHGRSSFRELWSAPSYVLPHAVDFCERLPFGSQRGVGQGHMQAFDSKIVNFDGAKMQAIGIRP
jgi:hypothetical protein